MTQCRRSRQLLSCEIQKLMIMMMMMMTVVMVMMVMMQWLTGD